MYSLTTEIRFHAAHSLRLGPGRAEPVHEHNWRVQATVWSEQLDAQSLVMDFEQLKGLLLESVGPLTAPSSVNELAEFSQPGGGNGENPSTERLARYIYEKLQVKLPAGISLIEVRLWETDDCSASFRQERV